MHTESLPGMLMGFVEKTPLRMSVLFSLAWFPEDRLLLWSSTRAGVRRGGRRGGWVLFSTVSMPEAMDGGLRKASSG